jgi:energy-converting hydrogenase A subunit E
MISIEFIVGCVLILAGVASVAYPRDSTYLTKLINMEVAEFGLIFIMLAFNEMLSLVTFIAVNIVTTLIFVRLIEKKEAKEVS